MSRRFFILVTAVCILGADLLSLIFRQRLKAYRQFAQEAALARQEAERIRAQTVLYSEAKIARGKTLADSLQRMGLDRATHMGIDYSAPVGTPVQAIGSGRVVFAGHKGGAGNLVHLQHSNGYETMYLHLARALVRRGQRVEQGQPIGLVGRTGLATGPHLDFRIRQHGSYRNFEHLQLPPAQPVAREDWDDFLASCSRWLPLLPDPQALQARGPKEAAQPAAASAGKETAQPADRGGSASSQ